MKNTPLIILSVVVVALAIIIYSQSQKLTEMSADQEVPEQTAPLSQTSEIDNIAADASKEEEERKAKQLDEGEAILDAREKNNERIENLLEQRNDLTRSVHDLIAAISASGDADTMAQLNDPKIQESIDHANKLEEDIKKLSSDNYSLKLDWKYKKGNMPADVRFSDPPFFKCSSLTKWKIENH
jgi:hypothetical protein